MTSAPHAVHYTKAEYVAFEASSNVKHELLGGQIYAMAGGSPDHAALTAAIGGLLFRQLQGGRCRVHSADQRVCVLATGLTTYPDLTIVCGPRELDPEDKHAVTNPTVVVEVLSPSTEAYDRGEKLEHYQRVASIQHVVLVAQGEARVDVITREGDGFRTVTAREGDTARLPAIAAEIDVRELYASAAEPT